MLNPVPMNPDPKHCRSGSGPGSTWTQLDPDPIRTRNIGVEVPGIRIPYLNVPDSQFESFTFLVRDSAGGGGNLLPVHEDS